MATSKPKAPLTVETLNHDEAKRKNIPTAEYQSVMAKDEQRPVRVEYARRNRDLDPQLVWRGKDEQDWSNLNKGSLLYLNLLNENYHAELAALLKSMTNSAWVVTYDDCQQIRDLYEGWATMRPFGLRYAAADRRSGKEILIVS